MGINVSNSPLPISVNFWIKEGGPVTFHYENYLFDERAHVLRKADQLLPKNPSLKIEQTNNIYTPNTVYKNRMLTLFPSDNWKEADYIILDNSSRVVTGAISHENEYQKKFHAEYNKLVNDNTFNKILDDQGIEVFKRTL